MNNLVCVIDTLERHRVARMWTNEAVAREVLAELDIDPEGEASHATRIPVDPLIAEGDVLAAEALAKQAVEQAQAARAAFEKPRLLSEAGLLAAEAAAKDASDKVAAARADFENARRGNPRRDGEGYQQGPGLTYGQAGGEADRGEAQQAQADAMRTTRDAPGKRGTDPLPTEADEAERQAQMNASNKATADRFQAEEAERVRVSEAEQAQRVIDEKRLADEAETRRVAMEAGKNADTDRLAGKVEEV
jgi:hypothetical protein